MPNRRNLTKFGIAFIFNLMIALILLFCPAQKAYAEIRVIPETVRVGLLQSAQQVDFSLDGRYRLIDDYSEKVITETQEKSKWTVEIKGNKIRLIGEEGVYGEYRGPIKVKGIIPVESILAGNGTLLQKDLLSGLAVLSGRRDSVKLLKGDRDDIYIMGHSKLTKPMLGDCLKLVRLDKNGQSIYYRGDLEIRISEDYLTVINDISLEEYLYGVVPAEMPVSFPLEALKAQAVAARSYLLAQLGSYASYGFDVLDNQVNHVYGGYSKEDPISNKAVDETRGLVLTNRGQVVAAFYHSSSGGYTDDSEDVWDNTLAYIKSKPDPADFNDKHYNWSVEYSNEQLTSLINKYLSSSSQGQEVAFSCITNLREVERSSGQRVKKLTIQGIDVRGASQEVIISNADRVRQALGLKSSLFNVKTENGADGIISSVTFTGNGWGHGLGMSQWGAAGLAQQGYSFQDILQYYYTDVKLVSYYGM